MSNYFSLLLFLFSLESFGQKMYVYPETFSHDVVDTIWHQPVHDPYRWLENTSSDETRNWLKGQESVKTRYGGTPSQMFTNYLYYYSGIQYKSFRKEGRYLFSYKTLTAEQSPSLYYQLGEDEVPGLLFNPNYLDKKAVINIDDYKINEDNKTLALVLSRNGGDWKEIRFLNMDTKELLSDTINHVKYSSIYWSGNKVYYIKYDVKETAESFSGTIKGRALYCHTLGERQAEDQLIYQPENDLFFFSFEITPEKKYLILFHNKKQGNASYKVTSWMSLTDTVSHTFHEFILSNKDDQYFNVIGELNGKLLVQTNYKAPTGLVMKYDPGSVNKAEIFIPRYQETLVYSKIIGNKILTVYDNNKQSSAIIFDPAGKQLNSFRFPEGNSFSDFSGSVNDSIAFFYFYSFYNAPSTYKINLNTYVKQPLGKTYVRFNNDDLTTEKVFYYSKDSTLVPMYLTHKKNLRLDGNNPVILYGYGGFGISTKPFFKVANIIFFNNGGILAAPCLRGGGDFPGWHEKGKKLNKQNTFDDFISAAEYLISNKYTNADKIAATGGSNGGLVVGTCMLQRPELFKVVVAQAGVYDMLRHHLFNVGYSYDNEFGTISDSLDFLNLYKYSPVHNVKSGVDYPATLLVASDNDDRVLPFHSFKFLAELQKKGTSKNPYVLYFQEKAGHSGSDIYKDRIERDSFIYAFIFKYLGIEDKMNYEEF